MKFRLLLIKRITEDVLMFPLILTGRLIALLKPLKKEYKVFYFFPFYHTGGAEKIHSLIAKATGNENCIIFFTRKSQNETFLPKFKESKCVIKDISNYTDNKWIYFVNIVFRGIISSYVNNQKIQPKVFNGQCNFGYKISPWIDKNIRQVELIHSISNFSYIRIPFLPFISQTVMISQEKIKEHIQLYRNFHIPQWYDKRINYIPNTSEFDIIRDDEKDVSSVRVLYSGRATKEKRSHLVIEIAKKIHAVNPDVKFTMAGDEFEMFRSPETTFIDFKGNISNENKLKEVYKQNNVLFITSSTEGFPIAVIEGMAYGNSIIATPVGDLPVHITQMKNGFLFSTIDDEEKIINEGTAFVLQLTVDNELLKRMSRKNIHYAQENFSYQKFASSYHQIIYN